MSLGPSRRWLASLCGPLLAVLAFHSSPAAGASIGSIALSPSAPIDGDFVSLGTTLEYESTGFAAYQISTTALGPGDFRVDIAVSSPGPFESVEFVLTSEDVTAGLGPLSAGSYSYLVNLYLHPRTTTDVILADSASGSFTVTGAPEPSALAWLALALVGLRSARGISSRRPSAPACGSRGDPRAK